MLLASTHYIPLARPFPRDVTTRNVSRHCQTSQEQQNHPPVEKHCNRRETTAPWEFLREHSGEQKQEWREVAALPGPEHSCVLQWGWWCQRKPTPLSAPLFPSLTQHRLNSVKTSDLRWWRDNCYQEEVGWEAERRKNKVGIKMGKHGPPHAALFYFIQVPFLCYFWACPQRPCTAGRLKAWRHRRPYSL